MRDLPLKPRGYATSLVEARGWQWLQDLISQEIDDYVSSLTSGVASWEDYHYERGIMVGLNRLKQIVDDALEEPEGDNV